MADKKITDLQLASSVTASFSIPGDNGVQTYRFTPLQFFDYLRPLFIPESDEISNLQIACTFASNTMSVYVKTNAGTNPTSTDKVRVAFRSATLGDGSYNLRTISSSLFMNMTSGSTFGQVSAQPSRIWLYLMDNAGTVELAASHSYFPETALMTTTVEGGTANSAILPYSAVARTNLPFRVIGWLTNTQATAGTWVTAPSQIQLIGKSGMMFPTITRVTATGAGTYYPPAGVRMLRIKAVGGGGGGGGCGTGAGGSTGSTGVATSFGTSLIVCSPGVGGSGAGGAGGAGGAATLGTGPIGLAQSGSIGMSGSISTNASDAPASGGGGNSPYFCGAGASRNQAAGGAGLANTGAGGGGGAMAGSVSQAVLGSGGGSGGFIDCIITSPLASYAYVVGTGGAGGTAGTSGTAGGAGAAGQIIIEEVY